MDNRRLAPTRGFTLIELVVGLAITGLVLAGARMMLDGLASATDRTIRAARVTDRTANADHVVRLLFSRIELGLPGDTTFGGDGRAVHFTTWCDSPLGWLERCKAQIVVEATGDTNRLVLHLSPSDRGGRIGVGTVVLARGFLVCTFRYLNDPRGGGRWFTEWGNGIVAPLATGLVIDGDTAILRIGERS